ncbi:peptidoglycan recognition family protein [Actinokineospora sp. UTMC 2448]|uniref:peptidoglycan recognition protein family protein n=1 Tax=Actinokineospora sp. UTMC 2448 TaxID=2268449 RepID=UPI002164E89B|nr:peptidoglycan recognition family protein [Actinokineospora sp. UTMC 2448]UVS82104.1 N-acetylmuramoyl-L-alanine amidase A [Actinokineospora sp. UTMC 2448]
MHRRRTLAVAVVALAALAITAPATAQPAEEKRQRAFAAAADEFDVPADLLMALSYLESRWDANAGAPSVSAGYGPMHLTDAATATAGGTHHDHGEDPRGDTARPELKPTHQDVDISAPALHTLPRAAELTGIAPETLRSDPAANIRGGAALLAHYQRELGPLSDDPADWYGAVARYSGATDTRTAEVFADEVYGVLRQGFARTTDDGQKMRLKARSVEPDKTVLNRMGLTQTATAAAVECPSDVACQWVGAPYGQFNDSNGNPTYGNHDKSNRPTNQKVDYIVIHDVEGSYAGALSSVQTLTRPASWHYTLRSNDGHIAQHVATKDVGWHAGNWYVNSKAIGLEHEGFAAQGTWYTEAMYRTSAKLVKYLAAKYNVPLDRHHIVGHDNVPGPIASRIPAMHWDPGPYWNWTHYFGLLGAPFTADGTPYTNVVTIRPDWATNKPRFTGCDGTSAACPSRSSTSVVLRSAPRDDAPLLKDIGLRPNGAVSTMHVSDIGSRVDSGQKFAVAERSGDWTAIWYLGQKGWLRTSQTVPSRGVQVWPRPGLTAVPVYGRAYPQASAYPSGITPEPVEALPYRMLAGQKYIMGGDVASEYFKATTFDPAHHTVVRGERYIQVQFGHRFGFVKASDVSLRTDYVVPEPTRPRR